MIPSNNGKRINSIDRFRGLLIFCMIVFQAVDRFPVFGWFTKIASHYTDTGIVILKGLTIADIVAPMFFFAIALTFIPSFNKYKYKIGLKNTYLHFIVRYLEIVGLGTSLSSIDSIFGGGFSITFFRKVTIPYDITCFCITVICLVSVIVSLVLSIFKVNGKAKEIFKKITTISLLVNAIINIVVLIFCSIDIYFFKGTNKVWDVLQAIGLAGLIALVFANTKTYVRLIAGVGLLLLFAGFHELPGNMELIDIDVQGGLIGAISWASMLLLFTVYTDLFYKDKESEIDGKLFSGTKYSLIALPIFIAFGVLGYFLFTINKGSVSPGYVLVCMPISILLFFLISLLENFKPKFCPLIWWGKSPIFMFLLQYIFVNVVCSVLFDPEKMALLPSIIYIAVLIAVITFIGYMLDKKKKVIKF